MNMPLEQIFTETALTSEEVANIVPCRQQVDGQGNIGPREYSDLA
jgi:hypothetical protein